MKVPTQLDPRRVTADTTVLSAWLPVPGFGVLPVNAFVIKSTEPVLVDTGLAALGEDFMASLRSVIDPSELRWIWITHADPDHIGNLAAVMAEAPEARIVTTFIGLGKLGMHGIAPDRAYLLNPGQQLEVGDRILSAVSPPCFDAPETTAVLDDKTATLFSSDCFGALLDQPVDDAAAMHPDALRQGQTAWASVDAPWLGRINRDAFRDQLDAIRRLGAQTVLGSHLPPAPGMTETLLENLWHACDAPAFVGPDQAALERMMSAA